MHVLRARGSIPDEAAMTSILTAMMKTIDKLGRQQDWQNKQTRVSGQEDLNMIHIINTFRVST